MNQEQVKSVVRWAIAMFGGYAVGKGWVTKEQLDLLGGDMTFTVLFSVAGALGSLAMGIWGLIVHKQTNAVAVVAAMPEVSKVEATNTPAGRELARDVGSTPTAVVTVAPR